MKKKLLPFLGLLLAFSAHGQTNVWKQVSPVDVQSRFAIKERTTVPLSFKLFQVDFETLTQELAKAPSRFSTNESLVLKFPKSNGVLADFIVKEASVLSSELASKYPGISSYVGYQKGNPQNTIRFSVSPYDGVNIMYMEDGKAIYMDSYTSDNSVSILYERKNLKAGAEAFNCLTEADPADHQDKGPDVQSVVKDGKFRTYRLALAATNEYSVFHINRAGLQNGTVTQKKAAVLAAQNTAMTRVNGIYEKTLSLTMVIVPTNDKVIFVDTTVDDGYTNNNGSTMLGENTTILNREIGTENYDIGHVFSTGGGGVATLRSPCNTTKARGVTGLGNPINDAFYVDYVAHEMGHQFGANHTFRAATGSCAGNFNTGTAMEPGSGTTIMAYAGICGSTNNVQNNSDPYFHSASVNEMYSFISRAADCSVKIDNNNQAPTADAGVDQYIPKGTAFVLTGIASDPDGDALTYLWEQTDTTSNTQPPINTDAVGPVFRSYLPSTSNQRFFPKMSDIVANNLSPKWEVIPNVARVLNFSLLVNDNKATGNQTARDLMRIFVNESGPFKVTSHTSNTALLGLTNTTVTWDVSGTNVEPINTANVEILLSKDGGYTYPIVLSASTPNTGSATVTLPNESIASARIMVKALNNIYFAINTTNFSVTQNLAVNEASKKSFGLYPNPAKHQVTIELSTSKNATYSVYDMSGRMVKSGSLASAKNEVSISDLKTGTYRVVVTSDNGTNSQNLIVK